MIDDLNLSITQQTDPFAVEGSGDSNPMEPGQSEDVKEIAPNYILFVSFGGSYSSPGTAQTESHEGLLWCAL